LTLLSGGRFPSYTQKPVGATPCQFGPDLRHRLPCERYRAGPCRRRQGPVANDYGLP